MNKPSYDIVIVGGGVAGATAACLAAGKGLKTALVEQDRTTKKSARTGDTAATPLYEWTHPNALSRLEKAGIDTAGLCSGALSSFAFHDAPTRRRAAASPSVSLVIVDCSALRLALRTAAVQAGAVRLDGKRVEDIRLDEQNVTVVLADGRTVLGRFLLVSDGAISTIARRIGLEPAAATLKAWCCQWTSRAEHSVGRKPSTRSSGSPEGSSLSLMLGTKGAGGFGYAYHVAGRRVVGLVEESPPSGLADASADAMRLRFEQMAREWSSAGILDDEIVLAASRRGRSGRTGELCMRSTPRGGALERDTHVGKRTLIIGDAGGFVTSISHEGLYPAIWSSALAVEVLAAAVHSTAPQEELRRFDAHWRSQMSDYLRPPNTDMRFLLPLVFSNDAMAARFAEAFACGTNLSKEPPGFGPRGS